MNFDFDLLLVLYLKIEILLKSDFGLLCFDVDSGAVQLKTKEVTLTLLDNGFCSL